MTKSTSEETNESTPNQHENFNEETETLVLNVQRQQSEETEKRLSSSQRSFSLSALSQNAYYHLYRSLPSTSRLSLPIHRTSLIDPATIAHSHHQILQIAIKKLIVVFTSVHSVISAASLALALIRRKKAALRGESRPLWQVIKHVWSSPTISRLAAFLASYSALWTLTYPALAKLNDNTKSFSKMDSSPESDHSLTPTADTLLFRYRSQLRQFLADWAAPLAGSVAGLALLAQDKQERLNLAPNLFCRGLYTLLKYRPLTKFPKGDLILFGISNAQIMSAFVLSPGTLPGWYWHWIRRVGSLDVKFLELHRLLNTGKLSDMSLVKQVIDRTSPRAPGNEQRLRYWLSHPNPLSFPCAPCHLNHPTFHSCFLGNGLRTWGTFKSMLPTYAVLHLVPALLFRSKLLMKSPSKFLISIASKTGSSALFLATFVWIILFSACIPSRMYEYSHGLIRLQGSPWNCLIGFVTTLSLLWEHPARRGELALYCAPKALSSIWYVLKARGMVKSIRYGEVILASAGTGMLMHCFMHAPDSMPALIRGTIDQLIDPHLPAKNSSNRNTGTIDKNNATHLDLPNHDYFNIVENSELLSPLQSASNPDLLNLVNK